MSSENSDANQYSDVEYPWRDEEILRDLYWDQGLSLAEVGERLGCNQTTVCDWMERRGIDRRGTRGTRPTYPELDDPDTLRSLLHDDGLTPTEIADRLGCRLETVLSKISDHGIPRISSDGEEINISCPTCDRDGFGSGTAMKIHHKRTHGESLAGFDKTCENCGKEFTAEIPTRKYCSESCMGEHREGTWTGENAPRWNGGMETVVCEQCGDGYEVRPAKADETRFCSNACHGQWRSENTSGEDSWHWKGGNKEVPCAYCGSPVEVRPVEFREDRDRFCDYECRGKWMSENWVGEDSPSWNYGTVSDYGPNWRSQRKKALERDDFQCVGCGRSREGHYELWGRDLEMHHKRPIKTFPFVDDEYNRDWEEANAVSNLMTCCKACHAEFDKVSQAKYPPDEYPRYLVPNDEE